MYKNVTELIKAIKNTRKPDKLKEIIEYDFKKESPNDWVRNENDSIKAFVKYRIDYNDKKTRNFDCDISPLAISIYNRLWDWSDKDRNNASVLKEKFGNECPWQGLGPDTINSGWTTLHCALNLYHKGKYSSLENLLEKIDTDFRDVSSNSLISELAKLTHSIGNFTLVPYKLNAGDKQTFNQVRGISKDIKDYFDISLEFLKENLNSKCSSDHTIFKSYIKTFYLNDYIDEINEFQVNPFFDGHKLKNTAAILPKNIEELNCLLKNVIKNIKNRGKVMVAILELKDLEIYKKRVGINNTLLSYDELFESVASEIECTKCDLSNNGINDAKAWIEKWSDYDKHVKKEI